MAWRLHPGEVPVLALALAALLALQQESGGSRGAARAAPADPRGAGRAALAAAGAADKDGRTGKWRLVGVDRENLLLSMKRAPPVPESAALTGVAPGKPLVPQPRPPAQSSEQAGQVGRAGQVGQVGRAGQAGQAGQGAARKARSGAAASAPGGLEATRKVLADVVIAQERAQAAAARSVHSNSVEAQVQGVASAIAAHATCQRHAGYASQSVPQYAPQDGVAGLATAGAHNKAATVVSDDDDDMLLLAASQAVEAGLATAGAHNKAATVVSDDDDDMLLLAASQVVEAGLATAGATTATQAGQAGQVAGTQPRTAPTHAEHQKAEALRARAGRAAQKATDAAAEEGETLLPRRTSDVQSRLIQGTMIKDGQVFPSLTSLDMAAREVANATGNAFFCDIDGSKASFGTPGGFIYWQYSRSAEAKRRRAAGTKPVENEGGQHMRLIAKRSSPRAQTWTVTEFVQPSVGVTSRFKDSGILECAYTSETLGALLRDYVALADEDGLSANAIKATLKEFLNEDTTERPDEWASRICVCAVQQRFGKPADNIGRLPALAEWLRKEGHVVQIAWCDGERVVGSLMAVLQAEHDRSYNSAQQVAQDRFAGDFSRLNKSKYPVTAPWSTDNEEAVRDDWAVLINKATTPGRQYLESLFWAPARAVKNAHAMLRFVGADACHMSDKGDAYTLFSLLGLTSNKNTVVWAYVWLNTNERTESWQAVLQFVKTNYPSMVRKDARFVMVADGDKGLRSAWRLELEQEGVGFFLCAKHRAATMTGKGSQSLYSALVEKPTQALLQSALLSGELSLQAAVAVFPHEEQFIAARVRDGRYSTYGRSTTQFVEGGSRVECKPACSQITNLAAALLLVRRQQVHSDDAAPRSSDWPTLGART